MTDRLESRKLSSYVDPHRSESETTEQWKAVERRLHGAVLARSKRTGGVVLAGAFAVTIVLCFAGVVALRRVAPTSAWDGAVLDSGHDRVSVSLGDGSHIDLEPDSRILVKEGSARAVHLEMPKGGAHFDVPHVEGRSFDVLADGVRVRVVGTRFSVTRAAVSGGHRVTVSVERGVVVVVPAPGGDAAPVHAGETWSVLRPDVKGTTLDAAPATPSAASGAPAAPGATASLASTAPAPPAPPAPTAADDAVPATASAGAATTTPVAGSAGVVAGAAASRVPPRQPSEETAQDLFERGNLARQGGDARGAAAAYEALLRHHPSDGRAGLSAFELGRLRMDQLGDLPGAVTALNQAIALAPGFREDALARLVQAYGALGSGARCDAARKEYLARYPSGVHAAAVGKGCGR